MGALDVSRVVWPGSRRPHTGGATRKPSAGWWIEWSERGLGRAWQPPIKLNSATPPQPEAPRRRPVVVGRSKNQLFRARLLVEAPRGACRLSVLGGVCLLPGDNHCIANSLPRRRRPEAVMA